MKNSTKLKLAVIILLPVTVILNLTSHRYPQFIEKYYSTGINKPVRQLFSFITGPFPTSFAEFLLPALIMILIALIVTLIIKIRKKGFVNQFLNILVYLSVLYVLFMVLWGFNYNRHSFGQIAGLKVEKSTKEQLNALSAELIEKANVLRKSVDVNEQGVMVIPGGYKSALSRAAKGYERASKLYPELGGKYGPPKRVLLSEWMCYTGITGIYMPYTGEANVNVRTPDLMLPCTITHEMAHQRGFAREDEANYIAYVTCAAHPDVDFQYSGVMLAAINSMNALAARDIEAYKTLAAKYSEGVRKDLRNHSEFWKKYSGKIEQISDKVNNTYLKSNGQEDGVASYGRMVDLLLAEFKANGNSLNKK